MKSMATLLQGIIGKHNGDYYYIIYLHSSRVPYKLKLYKSVYNNNGYCYLNIHKAQKNYFSAIRVNIYDIKNYKKRKHCCH